MAEQRLQIFALTEHDDLFKMYSDLRDDVEDIRNEVARLRAMLAMYNQKHFIPQEIGRSESEKVIRFCP